MVKSLHHQNAGEVKGWWNLAHLQRTCKTTSAGPTHALRQQCRKQSKMMPHSEKLSQLNKDKKWIMVALRRGLQQLAFP